MSVLNRIVLLVGLCTHPLLLPHHHHHQKKNKKKKEKKENNFVDHTKS